MKRVVVSLFVVAVCVGQLFGGKKERRVVPELGKVNTLFVIGNSQAADKAREMLKEGKLCLALAPKKEEADAVLDVSDSATGDGGVLRTRTSIVSATVTLRSGELVWSGSQRFSDAPFTSGSKTAAKLLMTDLGHAADCKNRKKE